MRCWSQPVFVVFTDTTVSVVTLPQTLGRVRKGNCTLVLFEGKPPKAGLKLIHRADGEASSLTAHIEKCDLGISRATKPLR